MAHIKDSYFNIISNFKLSPGYNSSNNPDSLQTELNYLVHHLPDYHLLSTDGDTLQLKTLKSGYYLIDFWYTSCYPCLKTIPVLKQLVSEYSDAELKIISINPVDKKYESIKTFIQDNAMTYKVYTSSVEDGRKFRGINSYPFFILYNADFKVISSFRGYSENLKDKIEKLITK